MVALPRCVLAHPVVTTYHRPLKSIFFVAVQRTVVEAQLISASLAAPGYHGDPQGEVVARFGIQENVLHLGRGGIGSG